MCQKACELDLEGIVAKWKDGKYVADNRRSSWVKIKNREYSQAKVGLNYLIPSRRAKWTIHPSTFVGGLPQLQASEAAS